MAAEWTDTVAAGLFVVSVKATVVLALAIALSKIRRWSARARYDLWSTTLLGLLVLPILVAVLPAWHIDLPWPGIASPESMAKIEAATGLEAGQGPPLSEPVSQAGTWAPLAPVEGISQRTTKRLDGLRLVVVLWSAGAVATLLWLLTGLARVERFAYRAEPLTGTRWQSLLHRAQRRVGFPRPVTLLKSAPIASPMTWGLRRPVILFPTGAEAWSDDCLDVVLTHELLHLRRGDWLLQLIAQATCAVYWFHPLAWLAARRHADERERSCDDAVVALGTPPSAYASHLLEITQCLRSRAAGPSIALPVIRRSQLERRIMQILNTDHFDSKAPGAQTPGLLVAMSLFVLVAASIELGPGTTAEESGAETSLDSTFHSGAKDNFTYQILESPEGDPAAGHDISLRLVGRGAIDLQDATLSLQPGAALEIETEHEATVQRLQITRNDQGKLVYVWTLDGEERPFDATGQAWLDTTLRLVSSYMEIEKLHGRESSLNGKISTLHGQRSDLAGQISSLRGQQSALRGQISSLRGQQSALRGQISSLRGRQSTLRGLISHLQGEISRLLAEKRRRVRAGAGDEEQSKTLAEANAAIDLQIALLRGQLEDVAAELEAQGTDEKVERLQEKATSGELEQRVQALQEKLDAFDVTGHVQAIERKIEALQIDRRTQELEQEIEALNVDERVAEIRQQEIEPTRRALESHLGELAEQ
ncbi:MAG: M56 family metallopeptidase [Acidobacteriota bacterium]